MATYRTAGEPIRQKVNQYQDDPIQNRSMTDSCWNGHHFGMSMPCDGWKKKCDRCDGCNQNDCACDCHGPCECLCHKAERKAKTSRKDQQAQTMDIMDSGCGTIDVK